jgi:hypothetical protein
MALKESDYLNQLQSELKNDPRIAKITSALIAQFIRDERRLIETLKKKLCFFPEISRSFVNLDLLIRFQKERMSHMSEAINTDLNRMYQEVSASLPQHIIQFLNGLPKNQQIPISIENRNALLKQANAYLNKLILENETFQRQELEFTMQQKSEEIQAAVRIYFNHKHQENRLQREKAIETEKKQMGFRLQALSQELIQEQILNIDKDYQELEQSLKSDLEAFKENYRNELLDNQKRILDQKRREKETYYQRKLESEINKHRQLLDQYQQHSLSSELKRQEEELQADYEQKLSHLKRLPLAKETGTGLDQDDMNLRTKLEKILR